jgi:hypothetical protein
MPMPVLDLSAIVVVALGVSACADRPAAPAIAPDGSVAPANTGFHPVKRARLASDELPPLRTPYLPPQCYVKTEDAQGRVHNPCFTCHVDTPAPNYINDGDLQLSYALGTAALVNPWANLFVDRRGDIAAISDDAMLGYVRYDNYRGDAAHPGLAARLATLPDAWDSDGDGTWSGWMPDVAFAFDDHGFDHRADGRETGWRAYAYFPFPGAFWPTNGSFGDAVIRLPEPYRVDPAGHADREVYTANFAIAEAMITRRDVPIDPTDEDRVGVDLDGDGRHGVAREVRYRWKARVVDLTWAGRAGQQQARGELELVPGMFPVGTEIAHSVRYLDVADTVPRRVAMAARMKELRYMVKVAWVDPESARHEAAEEAILKEARPERTRVLSGTSEAGISNHAGWRLRGFIEDAGGELRPQTRAELGYCIGCHSGVGATDDSVFSFGRKLPGDRYRRGWYHASQRGVEGTPEPVRADGRGEYAMYLAQNGAGDDLRENQEVLAKFFDARGALRPDMAARLQRDISSLLLPSPARALLLDKAYRAIVLAQSFLHGRDATVTPARNVHRELPAAHLATGVRQRIADRRERTLGHSGLRAP